MHVRQGSGSRARGLEGMPAAALLLFALCGAAVVIGWSLLLLSLLYVVASISMTTWVLTALGLALLHLVLAATCWHYAVAARERRRPRGEDRRQVSLPERVRQ